MITKKDLWLTHKKIEDMISLIPIAKEEKYFDVLIELLKNEFEILEKKLPIDNDPYEGMKDNNDL